MQAYRHRIANADCILKPPLEPLLTALIPVCTLEPEEVNQEGNLRKYWLYPCPATYTLGLKRFFSRDQIHGIAPSNPKVRRA